MDSSKHYFFLGTTIFFISFLALTTSQPEIYYHLCEDNGNYTSNSTYESNLDHLLNSLYTNTEINYGFYNFSYGENPNKVYAIALCRPDIEPGVCRNYINYSSVALTSFCPSQKEAYIALDNCTLHYANRDIFGLMELSPNFTVYNVGSTISDVNGFNNSLYILFDQLRTEAAAGNSRLKYATGQIAGPDNKTIYALAQCTPDLSGAECSNCLNNGSGLLQTCCEGRQGGRFVFPSCSFRFEVNKFYDPMPGGLQAPPPEKGSATTVIIGIAVVVFVVLLAGIGICLRLRWRPPRKKAECEAVNGITTAESLQFGLEKIRIATNNFHESNKLGQGGFGVVYKGALPDGQEIAVKRLSKGSKQGEIEFKNEILLVAKLQHKNLVRLLGFCLEREERLLVYEFVPNSSLDNYISDGNKRSRLDWITRYKIIGGIARGLLYLHEDSRLRIIHRDLKISNILLDAEMNPKISDFGLARLFAADQTHDRTARIVGTYGYMPPEYVKHGQFSIKSDVFSFGVLVLEIVSGQKRSSFSKGEDAVDLLTYAWENWNQGTALNLIDTTLRVGSRSEMLKCIHIGLLCVQENIVDRPKMASVVLMLSSHSVSLPTPKKPAFFPHSTSLLPEAPSALIHVHQSQSLPAGPASKNEASISELHPR